METERSRCIWGRGADDGTSSADVDTERSRRRESMSARRRSSRVRYRASNGRRGAQRV